ncbi:C-terminal binding protein [Aeromicrobium phragmitis]|uniref:C-terminal binding protein n=1 Tax=Aeromicrobium phragmitis TaxID=2478914 RepID=A0A3L8PRA8_9ACTN|nr:C-terminal binding protein [Aeromicrobium phragmitis]RLV57419.1 C-terminal binding protein [Aeromicrobium phragmitis]
MTRPVAAYTDIVDLDPAPGVALLEQSGFEVRILDDGSPADIIAQAADAQALLIGYAPVTAQVIEALPRLRVVATQSAGVDTVDVAACAAHGVEVMNVPGAATEEVASHALAMTLSLLRGLPMLDREVRAGRWDGSRERLHRLSEVTVGVLGLGRIGRAYASAVRPLVDRVVAYDPLASPPPGVEAMSLDEVVAAATVLSLHLPLTEKTRHLLDRDRLGAMPAGSFVVNVARGALIDSEALREALDSGHITAAALDVLEHEPPRPNDPLVAHPRTVVTPHAAYLSPASARDYVVLQARNVVTFFAERANHEHDTASFSASPTRQETSS